MPDTATPGRREDEDDWTTRHARIKLRADGDQERPQVTLPESQDDDWASRHAETKRGS